MGDWVTGMSYGPNDMRKKTKKILGKIKWNSGESLSVKEAGVT